MPKVCPHRDFPAAGGGIRKRAGRVCQHPGSRPLTEKGPRPMHNDSTNERPGRRPAWRVLILDRDREDPKWIRAAVAVPGDVRPVAPGAAVDEVTIQWVAARHGLAHIQLTPLPARRAGTSMREESHGERVETSRQRPVPKVWGRGAALSR